MTYDQPRRRIGRAGLLAAWLGATALAFGATAAAPAAPRAQLRPPTQQNDRVGAICSLVVGLPAGPYTQYQACKDGLLHSLAAAEAGGGPPLHAAMLPGLRATSYFSASNSEVRRREAGACAQIGYHPASVAFAQCVADLQFGLFDADHPL